MEIASQMILFANVVEHEGFSATARSLGLTPSAVSKQITNLENRLGTRLLNRSTRSHSLTHEGRLFYERCASVAAAVNDAEELVTSRNGRPTGTLRIVSTVAFAKTQLLPLLPEFLATYSELDVDMELNDRSINAFTPDFDLAIRFSEQIENTSVVSRKIATNRRIVCASPAYLANFGEPQKPEDLASHNCLRLTTVDHWNDWQFSNYGNSNETIIKAHGNFAVNSADAIYYATLAGLGIARLPTYVVGSNIKTGSLIQLLPDHVDEQASIYAIYPSKHLLSPKVRVFVDYLVAKLGPVPPWERSETPEHQASASNAE